MNLQKASKGQVPTRKPIIGCDIESATSTYLLGNLRVYHLKVLVFPIEQNSAQAFRKFAVNQGEDLELIEAAHIDASRTRVFDQVQCAECSRKSDERRSA